MSHNYTSNPNNPFFSLEEDVDDETFLKGSNHFSRPVENKYNSNDYENKRQQLLEAKRAIEERTIQSSNRSIFLLRDSEEIGISTAEELARQREQLEQTDNRLDDINTTLRFSQKHIQSIKSVFGGFKNFLMGGNKSEQVPSSAASITATNDTQRNSITETTVQSPNSLTSRLPNTFNKSEEVFDSGTMAKQTEEVLPRTNISAVLEKNLDEMSGSLARLKGLAIDLSSEIDSQNDLIDNIIDKSEKADCMLQKQDKDIRKLLKK